MTAVPLHMDQDPDDPELWLPYVDGTVDGRPFRFLLDTGAGKTRLRADPAIAELPVVGTKESRGVLGVITDELVMVKSLKVGPITKADLTVVRTASDDRPSLVGMDALGDMAMVLDLGQASVVFVPSGSRPTSWPLRRGPNGQPFLEPSFAGVDAPALACWDTGAAVTIVNTAFYEAHQELFSPIGTSIGIDATGLSMETPMYLMSQCTAGGIILAAHKVAVVPLPQDPMPLDLVLGYPAIRQHVWTMDYPLDQWSATPALPGK